MVNPVQQQDLGVEGLNAILGEVQVEEKTTGRVSTRAYVAFGQGKGELSCSVGENAVRLDLKEMVNELEPGLAAASSEKIEETFFRHLRHVKHYELHDLIPDTRKCLVKGLARAVHQQIRKALVEPYKLLQEFTSFLEKAGEPVPERLDQYFRLLIYEQLVGFMTPDPEEDPVDWAGLHQMAERAGQLKLKINGPELRKKARDFLRRQIIHLASFPDQNTIKNMIEFLNMAEAMHLELDLWECQNTFYDLYNNPEFTKILGPEQASTFDELGRRLGFLVGEEAGRDVEDPA